ncbi:MAG: hypothetical protein EOP49_29895, partial [Sphingobacteriales bacterium]
MPRNQTNYPPEQIQKLRQLVQQAYGKTLLHSFECELLSSDIERVTGCRLSSQTVRRFFGFLDSPFSPSARTLDALALYAGVRDWQSIQQREPHKQATEGLREVADLYMAFYKLDLRSETDMNYHNAARNVALRIHSQPALCRELITSLARDPVAQVYFFERFPFVDGLCTDYRLGLQHYLQKEGDEAQLFGNCLLFLSAFLSGDENGQAFYISRIYKFYPDERWHPFLVGRMIGSIILFEKQKREYPAYWIEQAMKWNRVFLQQAQSGLWNFPYFQFIMADYLNLAGYYKESYQIILYIKTNSKRYSIEKGYEEALQVTYNVARHSFFPRPPP